MIVILCQVGGKTVRGASTFEMKCCVVTVPGKRTEISLRLIYWVPASKCDLGDNRDSVILQPSRPHQALQRMPQMQLDAMILI